MPIDNLTDQPDPNLTALSEKYKTSDDAAWQREQEVLSSSPINAIGLTLEGFGAGFRGQEPLALKLVRQRQQEAKDKRDLLFKQQEMAAKLQQMKLQQVEQANGMFFKGVEALKGDQKALGAFINEEAQKGTPAAMIFKKTGVTTKDADLLTSPDFMAELSQASPTVHAKVLDALKGGDVSKIDPNEAQFWVGQVKTRIDKKREFNAEAQEYTRLKTASDAGTLDPNSPDAERFIELHTKAMKRREELQKAQVISKALSSTDTATSQAAAGLNTPEVIGAQNTARQQSTFAFQGGTEFQNGLSMAMYGKPYAQLDKDQSEKVLARQLDWDKQVAASKASGGLEVPEEVGKRTNVISVKALRNDNAIVHPPAGVSKKEMRKGDYVELSDKQMEGWNKLQTAKGQAKLAFDTLRPFITAKSGSEALSQAGRLAYRGYVKGDLPEIRAYGAMKDALASIMARFVEVGVLTNTDVTRWSGSLPGFTETKGSFAVKERIFNNLYSIASEAMKDSLLGADPASLQEKYGSKIGGLLNEVEKAATPDSLQDDFNTLTRGK